MYPIVLTIHSVLRWLVLIAAVAVLVYAFRGWLGRRAWQKLDDRLGLIYTSLMDTQLLVGLILYFFLSPRTTAFLINGFQVSAGDRQATFFAFEHIFVMLVSVVLAHAGRALSRRAATDAARHQRAAVWYGLSVLVLLAGIPWPFLSYGRPWNPFWLLGF